MECQVVFLISRRVRKRHHSFVQIKIMTACGLTSFFPHLSICQQVFFSNVAIVECINSPLCLHKRSSPIQKIFTKGRPWDSKMGYFGITLRGENCKFPCMSQWMLDRKFTGIGFICDRSLWTCKKRPVNQAELKLNFICPVNYEWLFLHLHVAVPSDDVILE